ncbi:hypothetical protein PUNSTDRAFT_85547 [Punctularia strigosozonata HHB-11173 SS5]|uniref:uncharacterized protein n=1 Tax=Punctularia strigosozonata (strain HHB-11173) TaxID=741275 RepID=UPI0004416A12|nr:uncharacterized protein PUNSTDRAFT_85547 [Punctularia strigosozonata HHB-11173 SS5]EIN11033.1 hypothetical protein PUNSTDRAFT_85547 [Punctularia strigosozonata HHB-11173 SS5]
MMLVRLSGSLLRAAPQRGMQARRTSTSTKSAHAQWYAETVPAMLPVALLGSAVYLGLQLAQVSLAADKEAEELRARVTTLEAEIESLKEERNRQSRLTTVAGSGSSLRPWYTWWF